MESKNRRIPVGNEVEVPEGDAMTLNKWVLESSAHLGKESLETVLSEFSGVGKHSFQPIWLNFCTKNPGPAAKQCFAMRKQGNVAAIASYYLAKTLYNLNNEKNLNVFAWCAVSAVKGFQQEAFATKLDYRQYIEGIVTELCSLNIQPKTEYDQILVAQIRHYRTVVLATEEHLAEAFEEQRSKYMEKPDDLNNLRELGWTLHDCLKQAAETLKSRKLVEFFSSELQRLDYPDEMKSIDEKLVNCYDSDLKKAENFLNGTGEVMALVKGSDLSSALVAAEKLVGEQPENAAAHVALAGIYDKMQRNRAALREYWLANKIDPANERAQNGAAWALVRFITDALKAGWLPTQEKLWPADAATIAARQLLSNAKDDERWNKSESKVIYQGLTCLGKFGRLKRPSLIYSQLLRVYTKVVKSIGKDVPRSLAEGYLAFVKEWDLANLTDDDRKPFIPKDNPKSTYPSLAENVVGALYRCATTTSRAGRSLGWENPWVLDFVGRAVEEFPKQQWYPYYYGKLLVEQGRSEDARGYIIKIAQQKMSEFWVWQMLAETYPGNPDRQQVCLCRAALCKAQDESFLVTVHEMLGRLLKARGMDAEALCEFKIVDEIRASKKWKAVTRGQDYLLWAKDTVPVKDNGKLYQQWAEKADAIVLEHLPSIEAVVTARYTDRERNDEVAKVWWTSCGVKREIRVRARKFLVLRGAVPGMPIRIWTDTIEGRDVILKVEQREDGHPWDIYPKRPGLLVSQDERRGRSMFVFGDRGETCFTDWRDHEDLRTVSPGTVCDLAISTRPDGRCDVRYVEFPNSRVLPSFAKEYSGTLRIPDGRRFGFVGDDIFVTEDVVGGVETGCFVSGVAARSYDRTKDRIGWKAVTMEVKQ